MDMWDDDLRDHLVDIARVKFMEVQGPAIGHTWSV